MRREIELVGIYGFQRAVAQVCEGWLAEGRTIVRAHVFDAIGVTLSVAWYLSTIAATWRRLML